MFLLIIVLLLSLPFFIKAENATTPEATTGIIIPLYSTPGPVWQGVINAKLANPTVPIIAIINPSNGPGYWNQTFATGIENLQSAGVIVLGYVHTSWGARSISVVEHDVSSYLSYGVNGIFFDEMSTVAGNENYYSSLDLYAKQLGYTLTVGNPGSNVSSTYVGTMDILCVYENQGIPSSSILYTSTGIYNRQYFAEISYGVSSFSTQSEVAMSNYVSWVYITSSSLPDPYDSLPAYFGSEVGALALQQETTTSSSSSSSATLSTVTTTITSYATATNTQTITSTTKVSSSSEQNSSSLSGALVQLNGKPPEGTPPIMVPPAPSRSTIKNSESAFIFPLTGVFFLACFVVTVRKDSRAWTVKSSMLALDLAFRYCEKLLNWVFPKVKKALGF